MYICTTKCTIYVIYYICHLLYMPKTLPTFNSWNKLLKSLSSGTRLILMYMLPPNNYTSQSCLPVFPNNSSDLNKTPQRNEGLHRSVKHPNVTWTEIHLKFTGIHMNFVKLCSHEFIWNSSREFTQCLSENWSMWNSYELKVIKKSRELHMNFMQVN